MIAFKIEHLAGLKYSSKPLLYVSGTDIDSDQFAFQLVRLTFFVMSERVVCDEKSCAECEAFIVRTYGELREESCGEGDALNFCADLLELRHPGHGWYYYFCCTARLLGRTPSLLD